MPLRFGQRARLTPRLLLTGCGLVSLIVLVNVLLWRLLAAHDENDADLSFAQREHRLRAAGGPHGFLAMSDDEALEAMYPPTAERVPKSHSGEQPASACESRFTLLLVADQDRETPRANGSWHSTLRRGSLCLRTPTAHDAAPSFSVSWVDEVPLTSPLNAGGRGMELSELVWYAGRLLTCDDHTGIVYEIKGGRVVPAYILADGDGHAARTFKCEWAAVRHGLLYVGGLGRAWPEPPDDEAFAPRMHTDTPMWVKVLDGAAVRHANWAANYAAMREAANCSGAGYLSHEAALWDDGTDRWPLAPRTALALTLTPSTSRSPLALTPHPSPSPSPLALPPQPPPPPSQVALHASEGLERGVGRGGGRAARRQPHAVEPRRVGPPSAGPPPSTGHRPPPPGPASGACGAGAGSAARAARLLLGQAAAGHPDARRAQDGGGARPLRELPHRPFPQRQRAHGGHARQGRQVRRARSGRVNLCTPLGPQIYVGFTRATALRTVLITYNCSISFSNIARSYKLQKRPFFFPLLRLDSVRCFSERAAAWRVSGPRVSKYNYLEDLYLRLASPNRGKYMSYM